MADDFYGNEQPILLIPGDLVIMYNDGITECMDTSGNLYGEERLFHFIRSHHSITPYHFSEELIDELKQFSNSINFYDDITLVVLDIVLI